MMMLAPVFLVSGCLGNKSSAVPAKPSEIRSVTIESAPAAKTVPKKQKFTKKKIAPSGERCEKSACFKTTESFQGMDFVLQGAFLRKYLWIEVYTASFYLPQTDTGVKYTHGVPDGAKMIIFEYHRTIEKKKIIESIENKIYSLPYIDKAALRERFQQLTSAFETPQAQSKYYFVYVPGRGTALIYNGEETILIPGEDFASAFFGIWLYEKEASPIRAELLGDAVSARG